MNFDRELKTRSLDERDRAIVEQMGGTIDDRGNFTPLTLEAAQKQGLRRVTAARDILTGEWRKV